MVTTEKKSKRPQPIRDGNFCFLIDPKNTNWVEDVEILLPVQFCWIPLSGCREDVENVSVNQRSMRLSWFSDRSRKHRLGRGIWDLASSQVSAYAIHRLQGKSRKCLSQSEARAATFVFRSARKTQHNVEILLHIKFCWILFSGCREEVENVSANRRPGRPSRYFPIGPKTDMVEDVEILLPVKFRWIPFNGCREYVKNVSANQMSGWPSLFSDRPRKHKRFRGIWDLAYKFRRIPFSGFGKKVEKVSANQRPRRGFSDRPEKHKLRI